MKTADIDRPSCRRCGRCCLADFRSYVTTGDRQRWEKEGRRDILGLLDGKHTVWAGDQMVSLRDGKSLPACTHLILVAGRYSCAIYATRPDTCRRFRPGRSELCPQYGS